MRVYRGYMKLWIRNLGLTLLYFGIFLGMSGIMQAAAVDKKVEDYSAQSVNIAVIDEDGSVLSEGIEEYLGGIHNIVDIGETQEDIQTALFYRKVEYVVTIPENFQNLFLEEGEKVNTTKLPDSESSMYIDSQLDTFLNGVKVYAASGYTIDEAVDLVMGAGEIQAEVTLVDKNGNGGKKADYVYMFQYFPYMIIAVLGYGISTLLMIFRKKEINQRITCSSVSFICQNLGSVAAFATIGFIIWGICVTILLGVHGDAFLESPNKWYYIVNSILMVLTALAMAYLVGNLVQKKDTLTVVINVISLGMCFLCGVFVPLEILGEGVKKVVQFLPVYWYEVINETLGEFNNLTTTMQNTIWKGFAIQFAFAVTCIFVALMVTKLKMREE